MPVISAAGDWIYVAEFKFNKTADDAMKQFEHKEYALKYSKNGRKIMLPGVNFDFSPGRAKGRFVRAFFIQTEEAKQGLSAFEPESRNNGI